MNPSLRHETGSSTSWEPWGTGMSDELFSHAVKELQAVRSSPVTPCKVCGGDASPFDIVDFYKTCVDTLYPQGLCTIPVIYRMCDKCQFIFTNFFDGFSGEQWQRYVYNDGYLKLDPDYLKVRPCMNARDLITLLAGSKGSTIGLDYGGGNGMTAALMRENGWTFNSYDPFAYTDVSPDLIGRYNFCPAVEVFEHTPDPVGTLRDIVGMASSGPLMILISTGIHDGKVSKATRLSWPYASPRCGHISLYSSKSMQILAGRFDMTVTRVRAASRTHLLVRGISENAARALQLRGKLLRRVRSALRTWRGGLA